MFFKTVALAATLSTSLVSASPSFSVETRQANGLGPDGKPVPAGCCAQAAMLRFGCSQLTIDRIDPLVESGASPSAHLHQIMGGNSFNVTMEPGVYDPAKVSTCTSCTYSEDFSNYWTANLYFRSRNGSFKRVPQAENLYLKQSGGATIYYIPPYGANKTVTAFKPGFRMLAGEAGLRQSEGQQKGICHRCAAAGQSPFGGAPCTGDDTSSLPKAMCPGGIRSTITFPTCWDGKNVDSPDHKSHVAYPSNGTFEGTGGYNCPSTHPVRIPQLMYEIMWDTTPFNDKSMWPTDGSQPFVYSMGDNLGYGQHGDYIFGWKGDALQKAMDQASKDATCTGDRCPVLAYQDWTKAAQCTLPQKVKEPVEGWLPTLPGGVRVN